MTESRCVDERQKLPWRCGAVILNYNGSHDTIACAESLLKSEVPPHWIVLVDNASPDDSRIRLRNWAKRESGRPFFEVDASQPLQPLPEGSIILLASSKNGGYAAGNNLGVRLLLTCGADAFLLLNNDVIVEPGAVGALLQRLFCKRRPGLCGARIHFMGTARVQCRGGGRSCHWTALSTLDGYGFDVEQALAEDAEAVEARINFIYGACVMASRAFVETVGLMDERFFLYCEEQDWAYSARGRFDLAYAQDAVVWHREGSTTGHSYRHVSLRSLLLLTRSRLLLTWKHYPLSLPTVCLSIAFSAFRMVWRRLVSRPVRF